MLVCVCVSQINLQKMIMKEKKEKRDHYLSVNSIDTDQFLTSCSGLKRFPKIISR